jgi:acyl-CoA synthetase (NDP forming)
VARIEELPKPVDLAIVFVRAPLVPAILEELGAKGIRRVVIGDSACFPIFA